MRRPIMTPTLPLPLAPGFAGVRSGAVILVFVAGGLWLPWLCHQFQLAGATFLPMHVFVILAGLLAGWRGGLAVGLLTPLLSHALSGMPLAVLLPQITLELSVYGLVAGLAREHWRWGVVRSLLAAMLAGRLALGAFFLAVYLTGAMSQTPLGTATGPGAALWMVLSQGWPGILLQLALLPFLVRGLEHWLGYRGAR